MVSCSPSPLRPWSIPRHYQCGELLVRAISANDNARLLLEGLQKKVQRLKGMKVVNPILTVYSPRTCSQNAVVYIIAPEFQDKDNLVHFGFSPAPPKTLFSAL